jgi:hypothetical protein
MENEKDAVIRRTVEYAKRHPGIIDPDAAIMKEDKPKRGAKPGNKNAAKKGLPTSNAQKVLDADKKATVEQFNNQIFGKMDELVAGDIKNKSIKSHRTIHSSRSAALLRNEIRARWLYFLSDNDNTNKTLNQIRADFAKYLFTELEI